MFTNPKSTVDEFFHLQDIPLNVVTSSNGKITIGEDMQVHYGERIMHNALTRRMIDMMQEGFDVKPMVAFMENLMKNPSKTAVEELYEFLEKNNLPLTPDGYFLAYKRVRDDFKDFHSNTMDNSVGKVVEVPRNEVDDNRDHECSYGLHFCSLEYLKHFHGGTGVIVLVKVNPADVVAFPKDYGYTKGRTAKYEVLAIHSKGEDEEAFKGSVNTDYAEMDEEPRRDENDIRKGDTVEVISGAYYGEFGEVLVVFRDTGFAKVEMEDGATIRIHTTDLILYEND